MSAVMPNAAAVDAPLSPRKGGVQPQLLNEGQAAALLGISTRKFHDVRRQSWFSDHCTAIELGPRCLRWDRTLLLAAAMNAPRRVVQSEPAHLASARADRRAA